MCGRGLIGDQRTRQHSDCVHRRCSRGGWWTARCRARGSWRSLQVFVGMVAMLRALDDGVPLSDSLGKCYCVGLAVPRAGRQLKARWGNLSPLRAKPIFARARAARARVHGHPPMANG